MVLLTFDNIPLQHMYKFIKQPSMFLSIKTVVAILDRSLPAVAAGVFRQFGLAGYLPAWLQSSWDSIIVLLIVSDKYII